MGFAPVPSFLLLFLLVVLPAIAVVGTIVIVLMCVHSKWVNGASWWPFKSKRVVYFVVLPLVLLDAGALLGAWQSHELSIELEDQRVRREARKDFVLKQEFQYGELLIPVGSRIKRHDPFDEGEPERPLKLTGLMAVRFPQPLDVAGVSAIAFNTYPGIIELANDQTIQGVQCKKGNMAKFEVPSDPLDAIAEFGKEAPDGPKANFWPSQWRFIGCADGHPILESKR